MHDQANSILAESAGGYISYCSCCDEYNFVFNNLLLTFQQEELCRFCDWVLSIRYTEDTYLELPHGRCRVYRSPLCNLFLAFTEEELDELEQLYTEAVIVLTARGLVNRK